MNVPVRTSFLEGRRAVVLELTSLAVIGVAVLLLAIRGDWSERIHGVLGRHEILDLDEVLLAALVVTTLFGLASVRRWAQLAGRQRELDAALCALRRERDPSAAIVARMEGILGSIDDFVWSQDAITREMLVVSPAVERIYGITPEAMKANTRAWLEVIHPDDRERVASFLPSLLSQGRADAEYRIVREDGSIRFVNDRAWAIRDTTGATVRFDGIVRDVTEQRHLESQLRQSQKTEAVGGSPAGSRTTSTTCSPRLSGPASCCRRWSRRRPLRRGVAEAIEPRGGARRRSPSSCWRSAGRQVVSRRTLELESLVDDYAPVLRRLVGEDISSITCLSPTLGGARRSCPAGAGGAESA